MENAELSSKIVDVTTSLMNGPYFSRPLFLDCEPVTTMTVESPHYEGGLRNEYHTIFEIIKRNFGLLSANPKYKQFFDDLYTYPREKTPYDHFKNEDNILEIPVDPIPINLGPKYLDKLLEEIILIAKRSRDVVEEDRIEEGRKGNVFYLSGTIGTGKTILLNYIQSSKQVSLLEPRKVIWVTVRLTRDRYRQLVIDEGLDQAIRNKACYLILHYYRQKLRLDSQEYIAFVSKMTGNAYNTYRIVTAFLASNKGKGIYYDEVIRNTIIEWAICNNYSFIYAIDGIDEHDPHEDKYKQVVSSIAGSIYNSHLKGVVILSLRPATVYDIDDEMYTNFFQANTTFRRPRKELTVWKPKMIDITKKRMKFLKGCSEDPSSIYHKDSINTILRMFLIFLFKGLKQKSFFEEEVIYNDYLAFKELRNALGDDYRSIFEFFINTFYAFVRILQSESFSKDDIDNIKNFDFDGEPKVSRSSKHFRGYSKRFGRILSKSYIINEVMMCGYKSRYVHKYCYVTNSKGDLVLRRKTNLNDIFPILPNIFNVCCSDEGNEDLPLLRKVRILQYLNARKTFVEGQMDLYNTFDANSYISVSYDELIRELSYLGYDRGRVLLDLKELINNEHVRIDPSTSRSSRTKSYYITRKGENIIKKNIFEIMYLYFLQGDIYLDSRIVKLFDNAVRRKMTLDEKGQKSMEDLPTYIARYLYHVSIFIAMLKYSECLECSRLKRSIKKSVHDLGILTTHNIQIQAMKTINTIFKANSDILFKRQVLTELTKLKEHADKVVLITGQQVSGRWGQM
jgi:hypothetical protein